MPNNPPTPRELRRATDARTLLPGEDPSSSHVEDAVHWIRVYGELMSVKVSLLDRAEQLVRGISDDAMMDIDVDQRLLRAQARRYRGRYEYWLRRVTELGNATSQRPHPASPLQLRIQPSATDIDSDETTGS